MKQKRAGRLNAEFQRYIYEILKTRVKNPDLTEMFTITEVNTTEDLKHAKVFISVYSTNEEKKQKTFDAIVGSASQIRKEIGAVMHIRTVPEFHFVKDTSEEYANKIESILSGITYSQKDDNDDTSL